MSPSFFNAMHCCALGGSQYTLLVGLEIKMLNVDVAAQCAHTCSVAPGCRVHGPSGVGAVA